MKLRIKKLIVLLMCIPLYGFHLLIRWEARANNGVKFDFKEETVEYWRELSKSLKHNGGDGE